jgi:hypothetical protein
MTAQIFDLAVEKAKRFAMLDAAQRKMHVYRWEGDRCVLALDHPYAAERFQNEIEWGDYRHGLVSDVREDEGVK